MLIVGSRHQAQAELPRPQIPCIRWGGAEGGAGQWGGDAMIYSGNFHCRTIKSLKGGDSICMPLPATTQRPLSEGQHHTRGPPPLLQWGWNAPPAKRPGSEN